MKNILNKTIKLPKHLKNKYALTLLAFTLWLTFFDQNNFVKLFEYKKNLNHLKKERKLKLKEIQVYRQELKALSSEKVSLEKFAREQYFMKKKDEVLFVFMKNKM